MIFAIDAISQFDKWLVSKWWEHLVVNDIIRLIAKVKYLESYWSSKVPYRPYLSLFDSKTMKTFLRCEREINLLTKGKLPGLRQFLATESPLKMMKIVFHFTSKALFVLKIFKILSWLFGHVSKRLDLKDKAHFKFYGVTAWLTNNCNVKIAQYLEK